MAVFQQEGRPHWKPILVTAWFRTFSIQDCDIISPTCVILWDHPWQANRLIQYLTYWTLVFINMMLKNSIFLWFSCISLIAHETERLNCYLSISILPNFLEDYFLLLNYWIFFWMISSMHVYVRASVYLYISTTNYMLVLRKLCMFQIFCDLFFHSLYDMLQWMSF